MHYSVYNSEADPGGLDPHFLFFFFFFFGGGGGGVRPNIQKEENGECIQVLGYIPMNLFRTPHSAHVFSGHTRATRLPSSQFQSYNVNDELL